MPKVVDQFAGRLRGKLGDIIFKITHGISYAGRAPLKTPASQEPKMVAIRIKFGLANKLGHAVNALPLLHYFWNLFQLPGSSGYKTVMNKVMKKNFAHTTDSGLTDSVILVPERGITINQSSITLAKTGVVVELDPLGYADVINLSVEKTLVMNMVMCLSGPTGTEDPTFNFIHNTSAEIPLNLTTPLTINISMDTMDGDLFDAYATKKAYFALVTLDADKNPIRYSSTIHSV
jgi:hypothetical protein